MEGAEESSRAQRGLQWHGCLHSASRVAIDLDSDSDYEFLYDVLKVV